MPDEGGRARLGKRLAASRRATDPVYTVAFFHREAYSGVKAFALEGVSFRNQKQQLSLPERDGKRTLHLMRA